VRQRIFEVVFLLCTAIMALLAYSLAEVSPAENRLAFHYLLVLGLCVVAVQWFWPWQLALGAIAVVLFSASVPWSAADFGFFTMALGGAALVTAAVADLVVRRHHAQFAAEAELRSAMEARNESLNEQLARRNAELAAANRELEAFTYSVSHDLRAPLRAIDGFSRALLDDYTERLDEKGRHYLDRVRAGTQRMAQLIDDLLGLSRVTRGELRRQAVDLSALAAEVAAEIGRQSAARRVELAVAAGVVTSGDPRLLRIVLENLLGNAWKYTAKRAEARIEFGLMPPANGGPPTYFVRDDGAGFDMAYAHNLFGAFQRLHSAQEFEGTGIGLAIVQRIVHRHGGRIWADAAVDRGATFYFTLGSRPRDPETRDDSERFPNNEEREDGEASDPPGGGQPR
jgi:signal transduction histidine kinase